MAETGNFADPSTFQGPPPGVPTAPGGSGLVHESEIANDTGLIHESELAPPSQAPQTGLIHESELGPPSSASSPSGLIHESELAPTPSPSRFSKDVESMNKRAFESGFMNYSAKPNSMVAKTMNVLAIPIRFETAAAMSLAEQLGVPGAKEFNDQFNPKRSLNPIRLPNAYLSDISDFYIDRAAEASGVPQIPGMLGDMVRGTVKTVKFGIGLGANILGDPLAAIKVGQLTQEAQEIQKMGGVLENGSTPSETLVRSSGLNSAAAKERNLVQIQVPFSKTPQAVIKGQAIQDAASSVANSKPVQMFASMIRALSPDTGDAAIDAAGRLHDNLSRGDPQDVINRYMKPKMDLKLSSEEDRIASALVEATPNLMPELPKEHLNASQISWDVEPSIRAQMESKVAQTAKKLGIEVPPGREASIVEAGILAKRADAENLMDKFHAGVLTPENIADKVIENHLPHVMDPSYKGVKDLKEYQARLAADEAEVNKMTSGTFLSSRDITRERKIQGTLEEKNAALLKQKGLDNYFITDPVAATTSRLIESKRLLRDSQYLDQIKDSGIRMNPSEARRAGLDSVSHPELEGKVVVFKNPDGSARTMRSNDLFYPKEIASKIQYRIAKPALTSVRATLENYNRNFRSAIFMTSPGIRIGNALDNVLKTIAVTGKDFMASSKDALSVMMGKSQGFRSEPTPLRPTGVFYDGATLKSLMDKYGITQTGALREGMDAFMDAGKKLTLSDVSQRPGALAPKYAVERAKSMIRAVELLGEKGENSARATLFLQRLKAGFEPEQAANEVTKWLFDYNRNSKAMNDVRFAMPFMQHPTKTLLLAPELLGRATGAYNFVQNSAPHVIANAFHDPMTQTALNAILPDSIKQRDGIAGPLIPENTWMAAIFSKPGSQSMAWFDPRIGFRILNHFDYFTQGGTNRLIGETSPVIQALFGLVGGRGDFGKSLDMGSGNVNLANRASFALGKIIEGYTPFPNAEKMVMQAFGLEDPKHFEPYGVLIMKGLAGQFGGVTDLDRDVQSKMISLHYAYMDQKKQLSSVLKKEVGDNLRLAPVQKYVKNTYGEVRGMDAVSVMQELSRVQQEQAEAQASAQFLSSKFRGGAGMTAGDYAARMKGISDAMKRLNQSYIGLGARLLEMSQGAKSPNEAREKVGYPPLGK